MKFILLHILQTDNIQKKQRDVKDRCRSFRIINHHEQEVNFFSKTVILVPHGETVLKGGDTEYSFSVKLPSDARCSFHRKIYSRSIPEDNQFGTSQIITHTFLDN